ncbi:MAG: ABC transporter ATP-binding protein [Parvularculaceae bacterium]
MLTNALLSEARTPDAKPPLREAAPAPVLEARSVCVDYGGRRALDGVSFDVAAGEVFGLIGANGAGKSTLARAAAGRATISSGEIRIVGAPAGGRAARAALGLAPQRPALYDRLTARENLVAFARQTGLSRATATSRATALLARVGAERYADVETRLLSGGERQRVNIAAALVHEPAAAILDEPCASIDPAGVKSFNELIADLAGDGIAILLITHDMAQAEEACDRVGVLVGGRMVANDRPRALVERWTGCALELELEIAGDAPPPAAPFALIGPGRWRAPATDFDDAARIVTTLQARLEKPCAVSNLQVRRLGLDAVIARLADEAAQ